MENTTVPEWWDKWLKQNLKKKARKLAKGKNIKRGINFRAGIR